jgi:HD-like signal output (HDOD) protein
MLDTINNNADEIGNKKRYLNSIRNLPSIPIVMFEVTKLLDNPMTSTNELGKIISKDQGLTAKILTVANSPLYGLPRKVSTIEFAIVVLGFEQIKNIVIALSMIEAFSSKDKDDWNRKAFWIHSLSTAWVLKKLRMIWEFQKQPKHLLQVCSRSRYLSYSKIFQQRV